jgi:hypothetical protein
VNLLHWFWSKRRPAPANRLRHLQVVMFTRTRCHLCEQAWEELRRAQEHYGFAMEAIDVDRDPNLKARHGECVPVVTLGGKVRFRGGVNRVLLRRLLEAELARQTKAGR